MFGKTKRFPSLKHPIRLTFTGHQVLYSVNLTVYSLHIFSDGEHYIWATTAPRLRVGNGWKISHYHGELKNDRPYPTGDKIELWKVGFQPNQRAKDFQITKPSKQLKQKQEAEKPKGYVPPHARGRKDYNVSILSPMIEPCAGR